jgi:serine phosphatase RsbU (regulator of sigma subunit)
MPRGRWRLEAARRRHQQRLTFWSRFSLRDLAPFLIAVFFNFATLGFLVDIGGMGRFPWPYLALTVAITGSLAVAYALVFILGRLRWLPLVLLTQIAFLAFGGRLLPSVQAPLSAPDLASRLSLDTAASIVALMLGYGGFVAFIARQGVKRLRLDTEIDLAREIHETLVPRLAFAAPGWDLVGASFPAYEVGGDLVDAVVDEARLTAYVLDVSGHGVPAGTLMAALKSAARMRLLQPASGAALLTDLNRVLAAIRRPNMFATAACLVLEGNRIHYSLAGHLPILHWRAAVGKVSRLSHGQTALGILPDETFVEEAVEVAPDDVLAMVTDGLTEVVDQDERELGLEGLEAVLCAGAREPLPRLFDRMVERSRAHGPQNDDQTLLLIRVGGGRPS